MPTIDKSPSGFFLGPFHHCLPIRGAPGPSLLGTGDDCITNTGCTYSGVALGRFVRDLE